jgi:hypothetical protein
MFFSLFILFRVFWQCFKIKECSKFFYLFNSYFGIKSVYLKKIYILKLKVNFLKLNATTLHFQKYIYLYYK